MNELLPMITPARLREILGVAENTVSAWVKAGEIEHVRKGRWVRFEVRAVWEFIARHRIQRRARSPKMVNQALGDGDWARIERLLVISGHARPGEKQ